MTPNRFTKFNSVEMRLLAEGVVAVGKGLETRTLAGDINDELKEMVDSLIVINNELTDAVNIASIRVLAQMDQLEAEARDLQD